jgi:hypothetical protein
MADNWVEKRARHDQKLKDENAWMAAKAAIKDETIWMDAKAAITDCCRSFQRHYSCLATVDCEHVTAKYTRVFVTFNKQIPGQPPPADPRVTLVEIMFDGAKPQITVTIGENVTYFPIDANEERAFVAHYGRELSPDEFSRIALEDVFFAPLRAASSCVELINPCPS